MSHFYDSISNRTVDPVLEEGKLNLLFLKEEHHYDLGFSTLAHLIDKYYFRKLKISANYINLESFLFDSKKSAKNNLEGFIYYCESLLSVLSQFIRVLPENHNPEIDNAISSISKVISYDLDKMNLTKKSIELEEFGTIIIIIPKDELVENILQNSGNKDVRDYLIEYKSSHNDGNVKTKEELLKLLSTHVEGITKQSKYRKRNERLFIDTDFLYNNLNIRHNQEVKDKRFYEATFTNREFWLDLTFRETLLVLNSIIEYNDNDAIEKKKKDAGLKEDGKINGAILNNQEGEK